MWSNSSINLTLLQTKNQVLTQLRFHGTQNGLKPKSIYRNLNLNNFLYLELNKSLTFRSSRPNFISHKQIVNINKGHMIMVLQVSKEPKQSQRCWLIAKRKKSKIECNSLNSPQGSVNISVFWGKNRECWRSFRFTSVLGTADFGLQEIFKIIHHSSLFVWVLSESWRHSRASLLEAIVSIQRAFS